MIGRDRAGKTRAGRGTRRVSASSAASPLVVSTPTAVINHLQTTRRRQRCVFEHGSVNRIDAERGRGLEVAARVRRSLDIRRPSRGPSVPGSQQLPGARARVAVSRRSRLRTGRRGHGRPARGAEAPGVRSTRRPAEPRPPRRSRCGTKRQIGRWLSGRGCRENLLEVEPVSLGNTPKIRLDQGMESTKHPSRSDRLARGSRPRNDTDRAALRCEPGRQPRSRARQRRARRAAIAPAAAETDRGQARGSQPPDHARPPATPAPAGTAERRPAARNKTSTTTPRPAPMATKPTTAAGTEPPQPADREAQCLEASSHQRDRAEAAVQR